MAQKLTQDDVMKLLDTLYEQTIDGIPKLSPPVSELAEEYLKRYSDPREAAKKMVDAQIIKCTTSGVVTGLGGLISLPVSIPANLGSVLYVQMRMITCVAYMAGLEVNSDQTQTLVYACLAGLSIGEVLKNVGVQIGQKVATAAIQKIPGKVLIAINKKVGFRLLTKFGTKGVINLGSLVPGLGAIIGGVVDFSETKVIGNRAISMFFDGNFDVPGDNEVVDESEIPEVEDAFIELVDDASEEVDVDISAPTAE